MNRRLMSLAPLAPAVAIIAFAAAGAAAQGVAAGVASTRAGAGQNVIEDVQVGERDNLLRVALICRGECRVAARASGVFFLPGVQSALDVNLAGRSHNATGLRFVPVEGGSTLTIEAEAAILRASIKRCEIDHSPASCIDLEFAGGKAGAAKIANGAPSSKPKAPTQEKQAATSPAKAAPERMASAPTLRNGESDEAAASVSAPALRDAPDERLVFARFAPPERFAPPVDMQPFGAPVKKSEGPRPIIDRDKAAALIGSDVDIAAAAQEILGKRFGPAECGGSEARLRSDAWALEAMVNVGFCSAIAGDLEKADGVFIRLLEYTPDNYEALVGRALIAAKAGEKGVARKYFQDALNALPPIAESDRIVEAMAKL
ncbi:MAG TPA: hypothetical protein PK585_06770 [Amphiplicatus sp.]|nr:hypothetical protein [Amphiplicatus sp.]